MTATVSGAISALFAGAQAAMTGKVGNDGQPVLVTLGSPGQFQPTDVVAVGMAFRLPVTRPTSGTNRSREVTAEIDTIISVYVPGDETAQALANAEALDLLTTLETWVRTSPNEKLSGNARDSWLSGYTLDVAIATQAFDDPEIPPAVTGRIAEITATVTAAVRY